MTSNTKKGIVATVIIAIAAASAYLIYKSVSKNKQTDIDPVIDPVIPTPTYTPLPPSYSNNPIPDAIITPSSSPIGKMASAKYDGVKVYNTFPDRTANVNSQRTTRNKNQYILTVRFVTNGYYSDGISSVPTSVVNLR